MSHPAPAPAPLRFSGDKRGEGLAFETVAAKNESSPASKANSHGCRGQGCGDVPSGRDVN